MITKDHAQAFPPVEYNHFLVNKTWMIMSILSSQAPPKTKDYFLELEPVRK